MHIWWFTPMCSQPVYESCAVIPWKSSTMCLSVLLERDVSTDIRQPVLPCTVTTTPLFSPQGPPQSAAVEDLLLHEPLLDGFVVGAERRCRARLPAIRAEARDGRLQKVRTQLGGPPM